MEARIPGEGAVKNGVKQADAKYIFELVDKFAGYGFNKRHAAAYALVCYQTAYLKANHPVEFFSAMMTNDVSDTDKLAEYIAEARTLGIPDHVISMSATPHGLILVSGATGSNTKRMPRV